MPEDALRAIRDTGQVKIGSTVKVLMPDYSEKLFIIRGSRESNPETGIISDVCPIGRALMGSKPGDIVRYKVMNKEFTVKVAEGL